MLATPQTTDTVFMLRPAHFGLNHQTIATNVFQPQTKNNILSPITTQKIAQQALVEFDNFVSELKNVGINVLVINDSDNPVCPDAVFPNNWISFHKQGRAILYPLLAPNRRAERCPDFITQIGSNLINITYKTIDFSYLEGEEIFLEGTGSLVLDHTHKIALANISERTTLKAVHLWCEQMQYTSLCFNALTKDNQPIYHTNVITCIGNNFIVFCLEVIKNPDEKAAIVQYIGQTNRRLIEISEEQMFKFAGNMLQLHNKFAENVLVCSKAAWQSLNANQQQQLKTLNKHLVLPNLETIEHYGGGSARCMLAEVFY